MTLERFLRPPPPTAGTERSNQDLQRTRAARERTKPALFVGIGTQLIAERLLLLVFLLLSHPHTRAPPALGQSLAKAWPAMGTLLQTVRGINIIEPKNVSVLQQQNNLGHKERKEGHGQ